MITFRDAVNSAEFDIKGLNAENMERRLKLQLADLDSEIAEHKPRMVTFEEAKQILNRPIYGLNN